MSCYLCEKNFDNLDNYIDKIDHGWKKEYHKSCWAEEKRRHQEIDEVQRENQQKISTQFQISEEQQAEMEAEGEAEMSDPDAYSYPHESQTTLKDWEEHIEDLDFDKDMSTLIIEPNKYIFEDNKLTITKEEFPKLKVLHANNCGLEDVEIDCPTLTWLYLNGNELTSIDLSKVPNLEVLWVSHNQLETLETKHLKNLETLWCFNNCLRELNCFGMKNLEDLNCSNNAWYGEEIESTSSSVIKTVSSMMETLWLVGCSNLKYLDADLNDLEDLSFVTSQLTSLEEISLRQNKQEQFYWLDENEEKKMGYNETVADEELILNSSYLTRVDISNSNFKGFINKANKEQGKETEVIQSSDNEDAPTEWEQRAFERRQQKERERYGLKEDKPSPTEQDENIITDPTQLTNDYPKLLDKAGQDQDLDLSHMDLTGTMILDGWTNLRTLNVGNNYLSYLVVKNCPQLTTLRYAHNALRHDVWIDNCPNLTTIDKNNYDGGIIWDQASHDQFEQGELKPQIDNKKEKSESTESEQNFLKITQLIKQIEQALTQNNLTTAQELLTELKELAKQPNSLIQADQLQAQINDLEKRLQEQTQLVDSHQKNYWPLIIGSITVGLVIIGMMFWLVNEWVKKQLVKVK
jgi:Leucine-rich repeat (LRR) protein